MMRVEHEYDRGGALAYLAAWDVHRGRVFGRCEKTTGIEVHRYGAHIFHTSNERIWNYVNQFATFNHYVNRVKVRLGDRLLSFPINLFTLHQLFGVTSPAEAEAVEVGVDGDHVDLAHLTRVQLGPAEAGQPAVALVQQDMKKLIAYSSIAHMGFVTLGAFAAFQPEMPAERCFTLV